MYKLNDEKITKDRVEELLEDLSMFPFNAEDFKLTKEGRKKKYLKTLEADKRIRIAENLVITLD